MAVIKCKMCGGDLELIPGSSVAECEYCGTMQTVPTADNEKKLNLFARANRLRAACEFDKAAGVFESIVADFQEEAEAYWGLVLCKYGIEYVDDPGTGRKIPTCHRSSFESIMTDTDFQLTLECADVVARRVYREEAKQIEELRKGIIQVSANEAPYDIFICYKETAPDGNRTLDSVLAQDIYDALTEKGYRVFFSRITLEDKLGQEYEPYIFAALNSAKIMLAVGTDFEYYNAVWVKNEWSRFLKLMTQDKGKYLIPCYKGLDAYDMPPEFAKLQAQDLGKIGAMQDLLRGIEKLLPKTVQPTAAPAQPAASALVMRGQFALEDDDWEKADEYFERALDQNPQDGQAYLGKALVQLRLRSPQQIGELARDLGGIKELDRAIRFCDPATAAQLEQLREAALKRHWVVRFSSVLNHIRQKKATEEDRLRHQAELAEKAAEEHRRILLQQYQAACAAMDHSTTEYHYRLAAQEFAKVSEYSNAEQLQQECLRRAAELHRAAEARHEEEARQAAARQAAARQAAARQAAWEALTAEARNLRAEQANLGLFSGKRRKEIDTRLLEIQQLLQRYKPQ